jgi:hypothetical protein
MRRRIHVKSYEEEDTAWYIVIVVVYSKYTRASASMPSRL